MSELEATQPKPFSDDDKQFRRLAEACLARIHEDLFALRSWLRALPQGAERAALMREIKRLRRYERALQTILAKSGGDVELAEAEELVKAQEAALNSPDVAFIREFTRPSVTPDAGARTLH